jgi:hypothetical protein
MILPVATAPIRLTRALLSDDARFRLHGLLVARPAARRVYAALQPKIRGGVVTDRTELVLEGYPRSANTYALAAFRCANGNGPVVADHLHAASSVVEGASRGLPVIVVVRDPVDAAASLIQRQHVRPVTALEAYVRFHTAIRPHLDHVVVSDFEVTTSSFGSAIEAANARFGTSFAPYRRTEANEAWCRRFVTDADRADQGQVRQSTVALPQQGRREQRGPVVDAVLRESSLVEQARSLYDELRGASVRAAAP